MSQHYQIIFISCGYVFLRNNTTIVDKPLFTVPSFGELISLPDIYIRLQCLIRG